MTIGYVTTPYFGTRRKTHPLMKRDPLLYVKKHIEYLNAQTIKVDKIYLVCTFADDVDKSSILKTISDLCGNDPRYIVVERENLGASYASWKHALHIDNGTCDYLILTEDDYCLYDKDSISLMLEYFSKDPELFYLCQYWETKKQYRSRLGKINQHAAMASGMLNNKRYYDLRVSKGLDFTIFYEKTYPSFCENQAVFLEDYRKNGIKILDWTKTYGSFFPNTKIEYGNPNGKKLMIPLQDDLGFF